MRYSDISALTKVIEQNIHHNINEKDLEKAVGFSITYIREFFVKTTGIPLGKYIRSRKLSYAAFDLIHTNLPIIQISMEYGFQSPDSFCRAFKKHTGDTPQAFRKSRKTVGRKRLVEGIFGVFVQDEKEIDIMKRTKIESNGSTVLYGVPKVGFGTYDGCTPYPICLKAVANYLGEDLAYDYLMAASGAAFRLTWNTTCWDGGNVDVYHTFDQPDRVYEEPVKAMGRAFKMLSRTEETKKEEFIQFIKKSIDQGYPCLAQGIIGPPEICIITGYRDGGETLLGWNFFQDDAYFAKGITKDACGYFITNQWWENMDTQGVITMEQIIGKKDTIKEITARGIEVLTGRLVGDFAKGICAYDAWKTALENDEEFISGLPLSQGVEILMCQGDAMDCLADGRYRAGEYYQKQAKMLGSEQAAKLCEKISGIFFKIHKQIEEMAGLMGGWDRGEEQMKRLWDQETRLKIIHKIEQCKAADIEALDKMSELSHILST